MGDYSEEEFRKKYPNLARELGGKGSIRINSVRSTVDEGERAACSDHGYQPTAVDFIRRCSTEEQALEIINYLEGRKEIDEDHAKRLRRQLVERGLNSFGSHKEPGYYDRVAKG
ncbi:MAG: DUF2095 family protein [Candidatus Hadarchaeum sp.]|uniref:DUF2095 family protein n=1 Tax=Candidatus Hadarchaeum sp. TaxID=2883567 RepID=UPI003D09B7A4